MWRFEGDEVGFGNVENLIANWRPLRDSAFLPTPEELLLSWRYRMSEDTGRLHVMVRPAWDANKRRFLDAESDGARRGREGTESKARFAFFDMGREWIVRGFADLTTESMHRNWERVDASTG